MQGGTRSSFFNKRSTKYKQNIFAGANAAKLMVWFSVHRYFLENVFKALIIHDTSVTLKKEIGDTNESKLQYAEKDD